MSRINRLVRTDGRLVAGLPSLAATLASLKNLYDVRHLSAPDKASLSAEINSNTFYMNIPCGLGISLMTLGELLHCLNSTSATSHMSRKENAALWAVIVTGLAATATPFYLLAEVTNSPLIGLPWVAATLCFEGAHVYAKQRLPNARKSKSTYARLLSVGIPLTTSLVSEKAAYDGSHLALTDADKAADQILNDTFYINTVIGLGLTLRSLAKFADFYISADARSILSVNQKALVGSLALLGLLSAAAPFYLYADVSNNPTVTLPYFLAATLFAGAHTLTERAVKRQVGGYRYNLILDGDSDAESADTNNLKDPTVDLDTDSDEDYDTDSPKP